MSQHTSSMRWNNCLSTYFHFLDIQSLSLCDGMYGKLSVASMRHFAVLGGWGEECFTFLHVMNEAENGCLLLGIVSWQHSSPENKVVLYACV